MQNRARRADSPCSRSEEPPVARLRVEKLSTRGVGAVDFAIGPGECVCLSGPSGTGKTLVLRALADLDAHQGEVYLDDNSCRRIQPPEWRRQVGLLPAESQWWKDTVGGHFGAVDESAFQRLGFEPGVLSWSVARLSSGERQRLAVLRLLANRPKALLLDEPTANLDPVNVKRVEELINDYRRREQAAVLWVSHDAQQIQRLADRHLRIENGRLVEQARASWALSR